ncbi:MAG: CHRD domain-containing protein [Pseudomonadota bacterium]
MTLLKTAAAAAALTLFGAIHASAAVFAFDSNLSGDQEVPPVVTPASGSAELKVNDVTETLSFMMSIEGIDLDGLFDDLVAAPVGPVHLHNAPAGSNGPIVVPFAFNTVDYTDTASGFTLEVEDYAYADAVAISGSTTSFSDFLTGLSSGEYYINVHTDAFGSGELRGQLSAVPVPASALLLIGAIAGFGALRRKSA